MEEKTRRTRTGEQGVRVSKEEEMRRTRTGEQGV